MGRLNNKLAESRAKNQEMEEWDKGDYFGPKHDNCFDDRGRQPPLEISPPVVHDPGEEEPSTEKQQTL